MIQESHVIVHSFGLLYSLIFLGELEHENQIIVIMKINLVVCLHIIPCIHASDVVNVCISHRLMYQGKVFSTLYHYETNCIPLC